MMLSELIRRIWNRGDRTQPQPELVGVQPMLHEVTEEQIDLVLETIDSIFDLMKLEESNTAVIYVGEALPFIRPGDMIPINPYFKPEYLEADERALVESQKPYVRVDLAISEQGERLIRHIDREYTRDLLLPAPANEGWVTLTNAYTEDKHRAIVLHAMRYDGLTAETACERALDSLGRARNHNQLHQ